MDVKIIRVKVQVLVEPDDGGWYAYCPDLKGLHASGDTQEEAVQNAVEAVKLYVTSLVKHNEPIPVGVQDEEWSLSDVLRGAFARMTHRRQSFLSEVELPVPA
jgi:predicted RNase H-like HicB family nuclease